MNADARGAHSAGIPLLRQPKAVWATAFAATVAFMGIGLVDPILPSIAHGLDASPSQVSWLFTSYFLVTAVAMLITGFVSSRIGGRRTLLIGLALVVVFAALSGLSGSVEQLAGFRAGWGLGNALFVSTSLAVILGAASGGAAAAILLYEAALGLGISAGPLLGAALGAMNWRYPFFGTAILMAIGFVAVLVLLEDQPRPQRRIGLLDPIRALGHKGLSAIAASAFFYYFGFFTILAFVPFVLHGMSPYGIGAIFFAWGLLLAVFSVLVAPRLRDRVGTVGLTSAALVLLAVDLLVIAAGSREVIIGAVVASGALMGLANTLYTEIAMEVSDAPRPVASAGYNFVRWFAGVVAPFLAPQLAEHVGERAPFLVAAGAGLVAIAVIATRRRYLVLPSDHHAGSDPDGREEAAEALADLGAGALQLPDPAPADRTPAGSAA